MKYITRKSIKSMSLVDDKSGCWVWTGKKLNGYGSVQKGGKQKYAHRVSYQLFHSKNPGKKFVCHKCDNPVCVNPDHLFLGTQKDNIRDMSNKGRGRGQFLRGEGNKNTKLTEENIPIIRKQYKEGASLYRLGIDFGVSAKSISSIIQRESWGYI